MAQTSNHPLSDQMRVPKTENLVDDTIEGTMNEAIHTSNIDGVNIDLEVNGKRDRPWDFPTEEGVDAKKKIKVNDETQMPQSPSRRHRDSLYNWPQGSPLETKDPTNGSEHRFAVGETQTSSPTSSEQQDKHDGVDHALFTESFDTISECPSTLDAIPEPNSEDEGLLLLRKKIQREEDAISVVSSPPKRDTSTNRNAYVYNSSWEKGGSKNENHQDTVHTPPQRVVQVDGDDNGFGDISPIKFSPPTESSSINDRDYSSPRYEKNYKYGPYISTPVNGGNEQQKVAEVSFDASAGSRESKEKRNRTDKNGRTPPHSASTLSEATTPPRRGTGTSQFPNEVRYEPKYSMPPHFPRELAHQYYAGSYYPRHPPVLPEVNHPSSGTPIHGDASQVYQHTRDQHLERNGFSSPIPASHTSSTKSKQNQDSNFIYRKQSRTGARSSFHPGQWRGHNSYSSERRDYPPPRARLPPPNDHPYWRQHAQQCQQHLHHSSNLQFQRQVDSNGEREKGPDATAARSENRRAPSAPPQYYPYAHASSPALVSGAIPQDPFDLFRSIRKIFQGCSYLLYPAHMGVQWGHDHQFIHTDPEDLKVARRRVESAICALGGYIKDVQKRQDSPNHTLLSSSLSQSALAPRVFRPRTSYSRRNNNGSLYKDKFHRRYFVGDHGVSWDVEENPPITVSVDEDDMIQNRNFASTSNNGNRGKAMQKREEKGHKQSQQQQMYCQPIGTGIPANLNHKMKYRCKTCGQEKKDHVCPYRKSIVRTLGIMVCPAVNAYSSAEPGVLSPPLSEVNNSVPYGRRRVPNSDIGTVSSREHSASSYNVTPRSDRNPNDGYHRYHSPSSLSTSPHSQGNQPSGHVMPQKQDSGTPTNLWQRRKPILEYRQQQPLFMTLALRPEHFRAVTPHRPYRNASGASKAKDERDDKEESGSYDYPHVPLTFSGRKWLTDTLFYLSQSIPSVTADVASLLRMARERDEWDLAVAEVLTQVVVCIHCSNGDYRLEGLKNYLLKIGIAS